MKNTKTLQSKENMKNFIISKQIQKHFSEPRGKLNHIIDFREQFLPSLLNHKLKHVKIIISVITYKM